LAEQQQEMLATVMIQEKILWKIALEKLYQEFENKNYLPYLIRHYKNGSNNQHKMPFKGPINEISPSTKADGTASMTGSTQHYNSH